MSLRPTDAFVPYYYKTSIPPVPPPPAPPPQGDLWYFIDDGPLFDSLPAVVDHYMLFVDGLPTLLRYPVPIPGSSRPNPNKAVSVLLSVMCDCGPFTITSHKICCRNSHTLSCIMYNNS